LVFRQPHPPHVTLSRDLETFTIYSKTLNIHKWRAGLRELFNQVEAHILKVMKGTPIPYHIPDHVQDDMTDTRRDVSWLNGCYTETPDPLMQRYLDDPNEKLAYYGPDEKLHIYSGRALEVMEDMAFINKGECVLHDQVNAQAYRGTSLTDLRIRNSHRLRNHQRDHGRIRHVLQYTKTTNNHEQDIFLPILVASELQRLDEMYLIPLRQMEEVLAYALWGKESWKLYREYFFVQMGQRLTPDMLYKQFPEMSQEYFGVDLTLSEYREWAMAVMREYIPPERLPDHRGNVVGDLFGQHGTNMARDHYARTEGSLPYLTTDAMWFYDEFSEEWQHISGFGSGASLLPIPIKFHRRAKASAVTTTTPISSTDGSTSSSTDGNVMQMFQTLMNKMTDIENQIQMQNFNIGERFQTLRQEVMDDNKKMLAQGLNMLHQSSFVQSTAVPSMPAMEDIVSTATSTISSTPMDFFVDDSARINSFNDDTAHIEASTDNSGSIEAITTNCSTGDTSMEMAMASEDDFDDLYLPYETEQRMEGIVLEKTSNEIEQLALRTMRTALGNPLANWRSDEQRDTVLEALAMEHNVVSVMKTGAGKSMTWIIPALIQPAIKTVVVVPYHRLLEQHLANAVKMGCKAMRWTVKTGPIGDKNLIFVAMESAASVKFKR
jgi:hypothetical protein